MPERRGRVTSVAEARRGVEEFDGTLASTYAFTDSIYARADVPLAVEYLRLRAYTKGGTGTTDLFTDSVPETVRKAR